MEPTDLRLYKLIPGKPSAVAGKGNSRVVLLAAGGAGGKGYSRPLAARSGVELTPNKIASFKGMLGKYNYEYRRPFVGDLFPELDSWTMTFRDTPSMTFRDRLDYLRGHFFHVEEQEVYAFATKAYKKQVADGVFAGVELCWKEWEKSPSSLVVPTTVPGMFFVRSVLATNFACLCEILKELNTTEEIETAWLKMPIVKPVKKNRGTNGGRRNNQSAVGDSMRGSSSSWSQQGNWRNSSGWSQQGNWRNSSSGSRGGSFSSGRRRAR